MNELKEMLAYTGIDVEQLVADYTETLHENSNPNATQEGSIIALKEWATKKEWLIRQVMAMPGYNGNLQSVEVLEVPNNRTEDDVHRAVNAIWSRVFEYGDKILSKRNKEGKTIEDIIREDLADLPKTVSIKSIASYSGKTFKARTEFDSNGYTLESVKAKEMADRLICSFSYFPETRLTKRMADSLNKIDPRLRFSEGMKTTRALGKVIKLYGFEDKTPGSEYGKFFISKYCEVMKEGGRKLLYVVSVNPIDYLKMSIGEFTSCHNINDGGWRSGCISYMLDKVSLITYTVSPNAETKPNPQTGEIFLSANRPELFDKIHRNAFHWDENHRLIQSRVYPQANDGCTDLYVLFRHEMQKRVALANGWEPDNWTQRRRRFTDFTTEGNGATNYPDWRYERFGGNLSTPGRSSDTYSTEQFEIGAAPTCIVCGRKHTRSSWLTCSRCY